MEELLKMIEEVDPADTQTLNEIDGRVYCYIFQLSGFINPFENKVYFSCDTHGCLHVGTDTYQYTRSRDALKKIRPQGWGFSVEHNDGREGWLYGCTAFKFRSASWIKSGPHKTEELAELHAIIQAIAYERDKNEA